MHTHWQYMRQYLSRSYQHNGTEITKNRRHLSTRLLQQLAGVSNQRLHRMQVVQNAGARFITGARRSECMTPVLCELHRLPVRQRITYKTAVLVYKCLHGWLHHNWRHSVHGHLISVGIILDQPWLVNRTPHAQRPPSMTVVLLSTALLS